MTNHHALAPDGGVEVIQADRTLYAAMCEESGRFIGFARDSHPHLQLIARHRLAALATQQPSAAGREEIANIINTHVSGPSIALGMADPASHRLDQLAAADAILALARPQRDAEVGWIVGNGDATKWRTWIGGWSAWTDNRDEATRYARQEDAEAVHGEDDDAWRVEPFARAALSPSKAQRDGGVIG